MEKKTAKVKKRKTAQEILASMEEQKKTFSDNLNYVYRRLTVYLAKDVTASDCMQDVIMDLWKPRTGGQERLRKWIDSRDISNPLESLYLFHKIKMVVNNRVKNEVKKNGKYTEYIDYFSNGQVNDTETAIADSLLKKIKVALTSEEYTMFIAAYVKYYSPEKIAKQFRLEVVEVKKALWAVKRKVEFLDIKTDGYDYFMVEVKAILNEEQIELFNLYHVKGLKQKAIAAKLGYSQANVSKRLKTMKRKLNRLNKIANIEAFESRFTLPYKPESMPSNWHHHKEKPGPCRVLARKEKEKAIAEMKA
jgi:DNA-directed RNA polymerase specialized sigma24 family protein